MSEELIDVMLNYNIHYVYIKVTRPELDKLRLVCDALGIWIDVLSNED